MFQLSTSFTDITCDREELAELYASHESIIPLVQVRRKKALDMVDALRTTYRRHRENDVDRPLEFLKGLQKAFKPPEIPALRTTNRKRKANEVDEPLECLQGLEEAFKPPKRQTMLAPKRADAQPKPSTNKKKRKKKSTKN
jgi:hypothetical protein